jgi:tetratricopeptide (TPR) repeat protein
MTYLNRFIQRYNGRMFVKDAWQQLAYAYYIQGNMAQARHCRNQILSQGSRETDADKQAYLFGKNSSWPALPVLKARLLLDGGYYPQAMAQLRSTDVNTLPTVADKLEYYFRLARVYDVTGDPDKAIGLYHTTIAMGRQRQEHFAARAALQMALLYEKSGRIKEAIASFKDCLSMKNHDFQANIDQQSKAGLNRLTHR